MMAAIFIKFGSTVEDRENVTTVYYYIEAGPFRSVGSLPVCRTTVLYCTVLYLLTYTVQYIRTVFSIP